MGGQGWGVSCVKPEFKIFQVNDFPVKGLGIRG